MNISGSPPVLGPRLTQLMDGADKTLDVVLRGHLHVEQLLDGMLEVWAVHPIYMQNAKLGFHQKLNLVRSLNLRHPDEPIWGALAALNTLRNDFAHRLTSDQRARKLRTFVEGSISDMPDAGQEVPPESEYDQLMYCFAYLLGGLESMKREYALRADVGHRVGRVALSVRAVPAASEPLVESD